MNVEEAKRIVADQKELVEEKLSMNYIKREVGDVSRFLVIPNVFAILGVRRSGKSTLSLMLMKELNVKFAYLNFDDESLYGLTTKDLKSIEQAIYEVYADFLTALEGQWFPSRGFIVPTIDSGLHLSYGGQTRGPETPSRLN
ncbi:putative ATPase (AAA+ superfamily) [Sulfolobus islandicus LAL14/1]|uniref:Putative ATPase (AAA+ superfamily) n=1 Tax=Saccharolobus islandicus LAL14/1 TaxID=1241935 RepID=M9UCF5_SACIS|nr:putative ATPase (AAA+ superfamily) [Sulfolobus islandicus LAL14/1]